MKRKSESTARWRVDLMVGNKARETAELQSPTAEAAIKRAIREFGIKTLLHFLRWLPALTAEGPPEMRDG
jgi:hypothetical protein